MVILFTPPKMFGLAMQVLCAIAPTVTPIFMTSSISARQLGQYEGNKRQLYGRNFDALYALLSIARRQEQIYFYLLVNFCKEVH